MQDFIVSYAWRVELRVWRTRKWPVDGKKREKESTGGQKMVGGGAAVREMTREQEAKYGRGWKEKTEWSGERESTYLNGLAAIQRCKSTSFSPCVHARTQLICDVVHLLVYLLYISSGGLKLTSTRWHFRDKTSLSIWFPIWIVLLSDFIHSDVSDICF